MRDIVIGVDASTTGIKAVAFSACGEILNESKTAYELSSPGPGYMEQHAEHWWTALSTALMQLTSGIETSRIAGIALTHQRETFVLIDRIGQPIRPAILWIDERSRTEVMDLCEKFDREQIREWSGKPPDPTPALYGLMWLKKHERKSVEQADFVADVGTFLHYRLTGERTASLGSVDPLGIVDMQKRQWHSELVAVAGLSADQLPKLVLPGERVGHVTGEAAKACGLDAEIPVFAAVGDGQANSLGLGVVGEGNACLSLGSGVVYGMYWGNYTHSDAYRTLTAPDGKGFILETVLRSGMKLLEWVLRTTKSISAPELEKPAKDIPPGSNGLLLLPYFSGVMNPWWDEKTRGAMVGLSLDHTPAHIYRSAIEAMAFEQAVATKAMEAELGFEAASIIASGGGVNSGLIMDCLTAIMNKPIAISPVREAAAMGAAMLASIGAGWFGSTQEAANFMCQKAERIIEPDLRLVEVYRPFMKVYHQLFLALRPVQGALAKLRECH